MFVNVVEKVRNQISSVRATTIRQSAGLRGDPIGEPRICWKTAVPMEKVVIWRDMRMIGSTSRMNIFCV